MSRKLKNSQCGKVKNQNFSSGLLSSLVIKTHLSQIPLVGPLLF